ncbi:hypothetical protein PCURB6_27870 [Paenibacillus curdlanolyticus]|nr:hypothetical protein PCURB6_27870 [Paenibacillus curdlanolyticus]
MPLVFNIKDESEQAAIEYAERIFNSSNILRIEMDLESKDNKHHLIIADTFDFSWFEAESK